MTPGRFLVFEGVEGAGKTTQVALLTRWLEFLGISHLSLREPGGTELGEAVRTLLLDRSGPEIRPETELLLMLSARSAFVRERVRPALGRGTLVISDRFDLSTLAYQGYGRGLPLERVRELNDFATGGLVPHLYLLLDLEVERGLERQRRGGKREDRIEGAGAGFLRRVRDGYRTLAREDPARIAMVQAEGSAEEVHERVKVALRARLPETFPAETV